MFAMVMLLVAWKNSARAWKIGSVLVWLSCACIVSIWILLLDSVETQEWIYIAVHTGKERLSFLQDLIQQGEFLLLLRSPSLETRAPGTPYTADGTEKIPVCGSRLHGEPGCCFFMYCHEYACQEFPLGISAQ